MDQCFYKIPFDFASVLDESHGRSNMCSELDSIDQHIEMLIGTYPGEHCFDRNYGTGIWDMDFERIVSLDAWKTRFTECLSDSISKYEKRISNCEYKLVVEDVLKENALFRNVSVRKKVDIYITATLNSTGAKCQLYYSLFLGPLSKD
ncbi:MAG: GPW/gp25 family protein [Paludibacteraceae bacterium]|nr:GPW/gp25 family protein [Paludibacteraceae bacterium]MBO7635183.1 GPW/gp25 family protein [Paludibacteraceae bacterium]MBR5972174.1 GPW/gp25 family protein [Paludibacteraceae bacterium]